MAARSVAVPPVPARVLLGLIAMLVTIVFRLHEIVPVLRFIKPAFVSGTVGLLLAWSAASQFDRSALSRDRTLRSVAIFFGWCALTVPTALYPGLAVSTMNVVLPAMQLLLVCALLPASMVTLDRFLLLFATGTGALGIAALAVGRELDGRLQVTTTLDTNDLGALMATGIPISLGLLRRKSMFVKAWAVGIILITVLTLIKTGSRGGVVGLATGTLLFAMFTPGVARVRWMVVLAVSAALAWPLAPVSFRERILGLADVQDDYNNTVYGGRKQIWTRGFGYTIANPIFGVGMGNFPIAEGNFLTDAGTRGKWSAAHNAYVQVAAELGLPGLAIFVTLLGYSIREALKWAALPNRRSLVGSEFRPELAATLFAFLSCSLFLSSAYSYTTYALLGMIALAKRVRERL